MWSYHRKPLWQCLKWNDMKQAVLYVHIPFCLRKCAYCDFNSYTCLEQIPVYLEALKKEASGYRDIGFVIKSVFIGGGTPTILSEQQLLSLIEMLYKVFNIMHGAEFTIEANPGTLTRNKLLLLNSMGVNRLSIGLQSYQDRLLKVIGRTHSVKDFQDNYYNARAVGFNNINVDLIFGLPFQTLYDYMQTLEHVIKISPEHVSCYSLSIEEGTRLHHMRQVGTLHSIPSEEEEREMYHQCVKLLKDSSYLHYEISNFAKQGRMSEHNLAYWKTEEYLGLGAGAHSYLNGERFYNHYLIEDYIRNANQNNGAVVDRVKICQEEEQAEYCFMGLRLIEGINKDGFFKRFGENIDHLYKKQIYKLKKQGLLKEENHYLKLTPKGLDFANLVFVEFLPEHS
jgi:oxygen-independent coproporphyrinogen-3 oxidase